SIFFFQAEDGIRDDLVTGVQTCALPICGNHEDGHPIQIEWLAKCGFDLFRQGSALDRKRVALQQERKAMISAAHRFRRETPGEQIGRASCRERAESWAGA